MDTEELQKISSYWRITDADTIADPAKLKSAFESTRSGISWFWSEVETIKQSGNSTGSQLRAILEMLTNQVQFLPLYSFEVDGTFVPNGGEFAGETCGTVYNGNNRTLGYQLINDIHTKIWLHYFDRIESVGDFWPFRDFFFPVGHNFWESREKTNEANAKIGQFLDVADLSSLENFLIHEENYSLQAELPEVYKSVIKCFIEKMDVSDLGAFLSENAGKLSGMPYEQFEELVAKVESTDAQTKELLRDELAVDEFGQPDEDAAHKELKGLLAMRFSISL